MNTNPPLLLLRLSFGLPLAAFVGRAKKGVSMGEAGSTGSQVKRKRNKMDYDGRFIHKNNPYFNRKNQRSTAERKVKFQFEFQNGEVLKLKLYEHLTMS